MNRVRFVHKDIPVFADLTILKTSAKTNGIMIPQYTIQDADVFNGVTSYEVELEVDNNRVGNGTDFNTVDKLMVSIRKCIRMVLSGIQCSNSLLTMISNFNPHQKSRHLSAFSKNLQNIPFHILNVLVY